MAKTLKIDSDSLEYGQEIVQQMTQFKPNSSYSFFLSQEGYNAVSEALNVADWGMGKNMLKMKETVIEIFEAILASSPGDPVNVNFSEYDVKSLQAVFELIERSLAKQKDGVLKK